MKTLLLFLLIATAAFAADDKVAQPQNVTHRITGLFAPDREADLRDALEKVPDIKLISIDFEHAEGMFSYDPAVAFKNVKPDKIVESFDQKIRGASNSTLWHAWTTTPGRPPGPDRLHDRRSARLLPRCSIAPGGPAELFHPRDE